MSLSRRNPRRDANEALVFQAFEAAGCSVIPISKAGAPDAVVFCRGRAYLVEVKARLGKLTKPQERFHAAWRGPEIHIVRTPEQALKLVRS